MHGITHGGPGASGYHWLSGTQEIDEFARFARNKKWVQGILLGGKWNLPEVRFAEKRLALIPKTGKVGKVTKVGVFIRSVPNKSFGYAYKARPHEVAKFSHTIGYDFHLNPLAWLWKAPAKQYYYREGVKSAMQLNREAVSVGATTSLGAYLVRTLERLNVDPEEVTCSPESIPAGM